jgi:hypothetical protein
MLTEMRRYAVLPGEMDKMHDRMSGMLLPLFREHGIPKPLSIWENRETTSTMTWMVQWPDFETRLAAWGRFFPIFVAARQAEGTPEFVTRTTLTLIAPWEQATFSFEGAGGECETAWHVQPRIGFGAGFVAACQQGLFDRFREAGATQVSGYNLLFGALPQAMILLRWSDAKSRAAGMAALAGQETGVALEQGVLEAGTRLGYTGEWEMLDRAAYLEPD